jgi:hypothetical protein
MTRSNKFQLAIMGLITLALIVIFSICSSQKHTEFISYKDLNRKMDRELSRNIKDSDKVRHDHRRKLERL